MAKTSDVFKTAESAGQVTHVIEVLESLPTVLHNRLSDFTRESMAIAFAESLARHGYRIIKTRTEGCICEDQGIHGDLCPVHGAINRS